MVSGSRLLITQFDNSASAAGSLDLQTSAAAPAGGYAFMVNGADDNVPISQLAIGGILNINNGALATAGSVFDYNDSGTVYQAQSFSSGSISTPDSYGRVTINLVPSAANNVPGFILTGYIIGNKIQLIEDQSDALNGVLGGIALGQGSNTGKFNSQSVVGASYAYGALGMDANVNGSGLVDIGGGFGFNANGTVSGAMAYNDLGIHNGNTATGNYTLDPTGRVTISEVVPSNISNAQFTFQLYLDGNGKALIIGADQLEVTGGLSFAQTSSGNDYEGNYALSAQGILNEEGAPGWAAVGPINISADNITGTTDYTAQGYNLAPGLPLSGTEDNSTGLFTISGLSPDGTVGYGYYPIDDNHVLAVSVSNLQIGLMMLEGITVSK